MKTLSTQNTMINASKNELINKLASKNLQNANMNPICFSCEGGM